ncbi:MAG: RNA polymerase sigma factor SigM [Streptosporangiaceae bacterium]
MTVRPPGVPSDADLLARHVAGDKEAFGLLVHRHRERLWAVAVRTLSDADEAADALQDALMSAFRKADAFRGDAAVTTWLHRIVVNACLDRARRHAARRTVPLPDDAVGSDPIAPSEVALDVTDALSRLSPDYRAALVLVDMAGFPVGEAADILAVPVGTVKSRCARGRARIAPLLVHLRGNRRLPDHVPSSEHTKRAGGERGS